MDGASPLVGVLLDLGDRVGAAGTLEERRAQIDERLADAELADDGVPAWLVDMLSAVRDRDATDWTDFGDEGDATAVVDVVRGLPQILPVTVDDHEESLTVVFRSLDREATVSWEGSSYRVSPIGESWS